MACAGLALGAGNFLFAGDYDRSAAGTTSGQFLKLAVNARAVAMGEAFSALADDASALYWNPAGLIHVSSRSAVLMHASYFASTSLEYAAYAQTQGKIGTWGASVQYMNYGPIPQTDLNGVDIGEFQPVDLALSLGFACYVTGFKKDPDERFVLGAVAKIVRSQITGEETALAADLGLTLPVLFDGSFTLALVAQNVMGQMRFDQDSFYLPLTFRLGTATQILKTLWVTADAVVPRDNYPYLAMGTELRIPVADQINASLRGGFNTRAISDLDGTHNVSGGFGLEIYGVSADYSFTPFGGLGNAHRVSLGVKF